MKELLITCVNAPIPEDVACDAFLFEEKAPAEDNLKWLATEFQKAVYDTAIVSQGPDTFYRWRHEPLVREIEGGWMRRHEIAVSRPEVLEAGKFIMLKHGGESYLFHNGKSLLAAIGDKAPGEIDLKSACMAGGKQLLLFSMHGKTFGCDGILWNEDGIWHALAHWPAEAAELGCTGVNPY